MHREMRRGAQRLSEEETERILKQGSYGVLAVSGDEGYPYAVPLNYVYEAGRIYFHCARAGHKLDAIARSDKVSFCVVGEGEVIPRKFATRYKSVIVFGRARVLEDGEEVRRALRLLNGKYAPEYEAQGEEEIARFFDTVRIVEITAEQLSGKRALPEV